MVELSRRRRETAALRKRWLSVGGKQTSRVTRIGVDSRREAHRAQMFGQARSQKDSKEHLGQLLVLLSFSCPLLNRCRFCHPLNCLRHLHPQPFTTSHVSVPRSSCHHQAAFTDINSDLSSPDADQSSFATPPGNISLSARTVVPERPQLVFRLGSATSKKEYPNFRYPYKVINLDPATHFYRSWSKVKDKDYIISPDWISEKLWNLRTNKCPNNIAGPRVTQL
ncbi:hypothetical protein C0Q70_20405 [Pomacea canaliculata]|uniref:Uncharacterized protein n=1 Tax=Pomacea canaliculata TaxID=400727 RepID=A0A2T7NFH0_POMCA|nr:hypothetical protein C0Q70_20405 [Pomacea canaliculata]